MLGTGVLLHTNDLSDKCAWNLRRLVEGTTRAGKSARTPWLGAWGYLGVLYLDTGIRHQGHEGPEAPRPTAG
jgi:hypothetical protein